MALALKPETLQKLQTNTEHIRNICVIAHVDHGKTTLSDSLISSNGIISAKLAGTVRYMDNTDEEQRRRITMKSSSISLLHYDAPYRRINKFMKQGKEPKRDKAAYLINLVDSPGHVDFSADVSTGLRVCDGAVVVIDAVEGVCIQTVAVMRQAFMEGIKPCLVINKVDRLFQELELDPTEAFQHLHRVLEDVNVVTSELMTSFRMAGEASKVEETTSTPEQEPAEAAAADAGNASGEGESKAVGGGTFEGGKIQVDLADWQMEDSTGDKGERFSPRRGNVVFASARDGWGFSLDVFVKLFSEKLGVPPLELNKAFWGEYGWKHKKVVSLKASRKRKVKPMFAEFVMGPISAVYQAVVVEQDEKKTDKIIKKLGLKIKKRDLRGVDPGTKLQVIMRAWLPLPEAVLGLVARTIPSPTEAMDKRVDKLWPERDMVASPEIEETRLALRAGAPDSDKCIVFVAKMVAVDPKLLPDYDADVDSVEEDGSRHSHEFLAFARVFSGTLTPSSVLHVLEKDYDPYQSQTEHLTTLDPAELGEWRLYMMMGRDLGTMNAAPAGAVVAIAGLSKHIVRSATLTTVPSCVRLAGMTAQSTPLVRVVVEPKHSGDMAALRRGLRLLNQADPCVRVVVADTGELQMLALGELHLQYCVDKLQNEFANVEVNVSPPIISFQETIISATRPGRESAPKAETAEEVGAGAGAPEAGDGKMDDLEVCIQRDSSTGHITAMSNDRRCTVVISIKPLPREVTRLLSRNSAHLKAISTSHNDTLVLGGGRRPRSGSVDGSSVTKAFLHKLRAALSEAGREWEEAYDRIWACGPKDCGPNLLLSNISNGAVPGELCWHGAAPSSEFSCGDRSGLDVVVKGLANSITQGFQMATAAGPLCGEPMWGVCFTVEDVRYDDDVVAELQRVVATVADLGGAPAGGDEGGEVDASRSVTSSSTAGAGGRYFGPLKGQVMSAMKDGCKLAFEEGSVRLVEAMFNCQLRCSTGGLGSDVLGRLYAVLARRRGVVRDEALIEGTNSFLITAELPVASSFGFAEELRVKTSGHATAPQLTFSHWDVLDVDPYFQPVTAEEREEFGDTIHDDAVEKNIARSYIYEVRQRKGLAVERKIVVHAEKQRNLSRKK